MRLTYKYEGTLKRKNEVIYHYDVHGKSHSLAKSASATFGKWSRVGVVSGERYFCTLSEALEYLDKEGSVK